MTESDLLYGVSKLARYLNVTPRQARYLADTKGLPTFHVDTKVCASRRAVDEWIASRIRAGSSVRERVDA
jgi:hypothetical protein